MRNSHCLAIGSLSVILLLGTNLRPSTADESPVLLEAKHPGDGDIPFVSIVIGGKTYLFAVNTGATMTSLDGSFRGSLGGKVYSQKVRRSHDSVVDVDAFHRPEIPFTKGIRIEESFVLCRDFSGIREAFGADVRGILGMDILRHCVIRLDPDAQRIQLFRTVASDDGAKILLGEGSQKIPTVFLKLPGGFIRQFFVDTGSNTDLSVDKNTFERLVREKAITALRENWSADLTGTLRKKRGGILTEMVIGDEFRVRPYVNESEMNLVGGEFLQRFVVTLDFAKHEMSLRKSKNFEVIGRRNLSGLAIIRKDELVKVKNVDPDCPAKKAGIEEGDVISRFNGQPTETQRLHSMREALSVPSASVKMHLLRNGRSIEVVVKLPEQDEISLRTPKTSGSPN